MRSWWSLLCGSSCTPPQKESVLDESLPRKPVSKFENAGTATGHFSTSAAGLKELGKGCAPSTKHLHSSQVLHYDISTRENGSWGAASHPTRSAALAPTELAHPQHLNVAISQAPSHRGYSKTPLECSSSALLAASSATNADQRFGTGEELLQLAVLPDFSREFKIHTYIFAVNLSSQWPAWTSARGSPSLLQMHTWI
jgi:hypothetical protein